MAKKYKTDKQIEQDYTNKIMNIIAKRASYYRANPQRWFEDFIPDLHLKLFQKILLWAMNHYDNFYFE